MEIGYDFSEIFPSEPIQRLDRSQLIRFNPRKFWSVQKAIDALGHLSTEVIFSKTCTNIIDIPSGSTLVIVSLFFVQSNIHDVQCRQSHTFVSRSTGYYRSSALLIYEPVKGTLDMEMRLSSGS